MLGAAPPPGPGTRPLSSQALPVKHPWITPLWSGLPTGPRHPTQRFSGCFPVVVRFRPDHGTRPKVSSGAWGDLRSAPWLGQETKPQHVETKPQHVETKPQHVETKPQHVETKPQHVWPPSSQAPPVKHPWHVLPLPQRNKSRRLGEPPAPFVQSPSAQVGLADILTTSCPSCQCAGWYGEERYGWFGRGELEPRRAGNEWGSSNAWDGRCRNESPYCCSPLTPSAPFPCVSRSLRTLCSRFPCACCCPWPSSISPSPCACCPPSPDSHDGR